jgi:hypothetical protein
VLLFTVQILNEFPDEGRFMVYNNLKTSSLYLVPKQIPMNKTQYQAKSGHIVVQAIKNIIGKLRQNPDVYPIRYYKKTRRFGSSLNREAVK